MWEPKANHIASKSRDVDASRRVYGRRRLGDAPLYQRRRAGRAPRSNQPGSWDLDAHVRGTRTVYCVGMHSLSPPLEVSTRIVVAACASFLLLGCPSSPEEPTTRDCSSEDADGDGFSQCDGDCDDELPYRAPNAEEICNGLDDNCDGAAPGEEDVDLDGFEACLDCDDLNPAVHPQAEEQCDGTDNNCDGRLPPEEEDRDNDG